MNNKIYINTNINLLQEVRVLHSLCDNGVTLYCDTTQYFKLKPLKDKFNCSIEVGKPDGCVSLSELLNIQHSTPTTKIGNTIKPLIFPKTLIEFCQIQTDDKVDKIYFKGLITEKRKNSINKLQSKNLLETIIDSSMNGRQFPKKTFDEDYFNEMKKYNYVFCPDGDFVWSYRFFETVMCGGIPVVENDCPLYKGFKYYILSEITDLKYDRNWVDHNLSHLKDNFTL
jgi:hypothetical protein